MSEHVPGAVGVTRLRRTTNRFAPQTHAQQCQRRRIRLRSTAWLHGAARAESYLAFSPGLISPFRPSHAGTTLPDAREKLDSGGTPCATIIEAAPKAFGAAEACDFEGGRPATTDHFRSLVA